MWGLLWDRGNLVLAGRYGVSQEEVDAMFERGEWVVVAHRTRPRQLVLVGPSGAADEGRMIACVAEVRDTPGGRRFRPIIARGAKTAEESGWRLRHETGAGDQLR